MIVPSHMIQRATTFLGHTDGVEIPEVPNPLDQSPGFKQLNGHVGNIGLQEFVVGQLTQADHQTDSLVHEPIINRCTFIQTCAFLKNLI